MGLQRKDRSGVDCPQNIKPDLLAYLNTKTGGGGHHGLSDWGHTEGSQPHHLNTSKLLTNNINDLGDLMIFFRCMKRWRWG